MLKDPDFAIERAALISLDQMPNGDIHAASVTPLLSSKDPLIRRLAVGVITRHSMWSEPMAAYLKQALTASKISGEDREAMKQQIAAFGRAAVIQNLVADVLANEKTPSDTRVLLLESIALSPVPVLPESWRNAIAPGIEDADEHVAREAVMAARLQPDAFAAQVVRLASNPARSAELRVEAIKLIAPHVNQLAPAMFDVLCSSASPEKSVLLRSAAADALGLAHLDGNQLQRVIEMIPTAGPLELPGLLRAFEHGSDADLGKKLVSALDACPASKSLRAETLNGLLQEYPPEVKTAAIPLLRQISGDISQQKAHLEELSVALSGGDAPRGRALFYSNKLACSTCHSVGGPQGHVGPDLSNIGGIRTPRDLLESVVYPSASFARGYEPWLVKLKDNDVLSGLIAEQTGDAIYLTTGPRETRRILRGDIADLRPGTISIMPQGFDTQLSPAELGDLIAFLASLK